MNYDYTYKWQAKTKDGWVDTPDLMKHPITLTDDMIGVDMNGMFRVSCTRTPTIGTLAEINAQVGDVVEWYDDDEVSEHTITEMTTDTHPFPLHAQLDFAMLVPIDDSVYKFSIVSRASGMSKLDYKTINVEKPIYEIEPDTRPLEHFQSGPVITETVTRKRIVPGVYGHIWIDWVEDGIVCLGLRNNALKKMDTVGLSREELIAARDVFNQLIDAMPESA